MRKYSKRARKTTRSRRFRKTRKQRGGNYYYLKVSKNPLERITINSEKNLSPRNLFAKLKEKGKLAQNESENNYKVYAQVPFKNKYELIPAYSWNTPISELRAHFGLSTNIPFEFKEQEDPEKILERQDLNVIQRVLDHYSSRGGKIILASSATNPKNADNVLQQFKFQKQPISPIILIDRSFFSDRQYDFYKYLNFKGPTYLDSVPEKVFFNKKSNRIPEENAAYAARQVQIFRKPAGDALTIRNQSSQYPPISVNEQKAYLEEVLKQAEENGVDTTSLELEICCINASFEINWFLNKKNEPIFQLINSYGDQFKLYFFSDGNNKNSSVEELPPLEKISSLEEMPPLEPITPPKGKQRSTMENVD